MGEKENVQGKTNNKESTFIRVNSVDHAEFTIYSKKYSNPVGLLEKLYLVRNEKSLTNEEKNKKVQKIMQEYME